MEKIIIKNSFCAWIDLLGYGAPFYQSDWDLFAPEAVNNLYRIWDENKEKKLTQETKTLPKKGVLSRYLNH